MIWRLGIRSAGLGHEGFVYFSSKTAALRYVRVELKGLYENIRTHSNAPDSFSLEYFETPKSKGEMLWLLTDWGGHPDND